MTEENDLRQRTAALQDVLKRIRKGLSPTPAELSTAPHLECWHLTEHHGRLALGGYVTGHPSLPDGEYILTSPLLWIADDQQAARTASRFYRLGTGLEELIAQNN